jgi:hypothetical protein
MKFFSVLAIAYPVLSSVAFAQAQETLSGQWRGITQSPGAGNDIRFEVKIAEMNGTWKYFATGPKSNKTCLDREFPLAVKNLPNGKWVFQVDGSSVILGCPSFALTLEKTGGETLAGVFQDGRAVTLKKL